MSSHNLHLFVHGPKYVSWTKIISFELGLYIQLLIGYFLPISLISIKLSYSSWICPYLLPILMASTIICPTAKAKKCHPRLIPLPHLHSQPILQSYVFYLLGSPWVTIFCYLDMIERSISPPFHSHSHHSASGHLVDYNYLLFCLCFSLTLFHSFSTLHSRWLF